MGKRGFFFSKSPPLLAKREAAKGGESKIKISFKNFVLQPRNIKNLAGRSAP